MTAEKKNYGREEELRQGETKKAAADYSEEQLWQYLENYKDDPGNCYRFYRYKLFEQWLEPTFDCITMTTSDTDYDWTRIELLYNTDFILKVNTCMNYFLTVVYFYAFLYAAYLVWRDRELYPLIVIVFFIGGLLFSLIWEAKGRYTMPYFVILIPLAAAGLSKPMELLEGKPLKSILSVKLFHKQG